MLELGRSCVHRDYRSGSVIMALWGGLGEYLQRWGIESMLGCASVPMSDGGHYAASLYRRFAERSLAPIEYHAFPRLPLPVDDLNRDLDVEPPALIRATCAGRAYLRPARLGSRLQRRGLPDPAARGRHESALRPPLPRPEPLSRARPACAFGNGLGRA